MFSNSEMQLLRDRKTWNKGPESPYRYQKKMITLSHVNIIERRVEAEALEVHIALAPGPARLSPAVTVHALSKELLP